MTVGKRLTFAALTVLIVLAALEGAAQLIWWRLEARAFSRLDVLRRRYTLTSASRPS